MKTRTLTNRMEKSCSLGFSRHCAERPSSRTRIIPTDTLDETEDESGNSESSSTLLQACGPYEPHPRQVNILLD